MRLMLGTDDCATLLVEVANNYNADKFEFWVINGAWDGSFVDGHITIFHPWSSSSSLDKVKILTDNQDRLRGEYIDVFENIDNEDYVAPEYEHLSYADMYDDIPF